MLRFIKNVIISMLLGVGVALFVIFIKTVLDRMMIKGY